MKTAVVLLWFVLLSGCAQYVWLHPEHNDQARFNRDSYECERDMRQSGYYGGGIVGQLNAQGFAERCMLARGYYKSDPGSRTRPNPATASAAPVQVQQNVAPNAQLNVAPTPVVTPAPATPEVASSPPRFAQLYLVKGRIVSNPPQAFRAEFSDANGKASVIIAGNRRLDGDFELFEVSTSIASKYTAALIKPDSIKITPGADRKGFARFSDGLLHLECSYSLISGTGRGAGVCGDSDGNSYQIVF